MKNIIDKVQVNIPFRMLMDSYLNLFLELELNPEIGIDAISLDTYSYDDFKKVAETFHENGRSVTVHGPFLDLCPVSVDPAIRDVSLKRFDQLVKIIPAIRPKTVVGHAGYDAARLFYFKDEWEEGITAFWGNIAAGIYDSGSQLVLENVYENRPEDILTILESLEPFNVGCCLDVGHHNVFSTTSLSDWFIKLEPYIRQFHLHDNKGDLDLHLPPGEGNIDFSEVFDFIKRKKPILTLEPHEEEDLDKMLAFYHDNYNDVFELL